MNGENLRLHGPPFANAVERKHSEERLMAAESRYRTVADFIYDWEYWQNTDGSLQDVSPSCERICGYYARKFIESPTLFHDIIIPEDKKIWDGHATNTENIHKPGEIQFRIKRKDEVIRWIEHVCQPIKDSQGLHLGFRASNRDFTKRKHYRSETDKLHAELAHMDRVAVLSDGRPSCRRFQSNAGWAAMITTMVSTPFFLDIK